MTNDKILKSGLRNYALKYFDLEFPNKNIAVSIHPNPLEYFNNPLLQQTLLEEYGIKTQIIIRKIPVKKNGLGYGYSRELDYSVIDEEKALKFKLVWCGD